MFVDKKTIHGSTFSPPECQRTGASGDHCCRLCFLKAKSKPTVSRIAPWVPVGLPQLSPFSTLESGMFKSDGRVTACLNQNKNKQEHECPLQSSHEWRLAAHSQSKPFLCGPDGGTQSMGGASYHAPKQSVGYLGVSQNDFN